MEEGLGIVLVDHIALVFCLMIEFWFKTEPKKILLKSQDYFVGIDSFVNKYCNFLSTVSGLKLPHLLQYCIWLIWHCAYTIFTYIIMKSRVTEWNAVIREWDLELAATSIHARFVDSGAQRGNRTRPWRRSAENAKKCSECVPPAEIRRCAMVYDPAAPTLYTLNWVEYQNTRGHQQCM